MPRTNRPGIANKEYGQTKVTGELDAAKMLYKRTEPDGTESVEQILSDTIHAGVLDAITVTDAVGLNITWTAGEIYTPAGVIQETVAGGGACTDDAVNYLVWASGSGLTLQTTPADAATEVSVAHIQCQEADIWEVHEEPVITDTVPAIQAGLGGLFPVIVESGCVVTPDAGGAAFECSVSAGIYWHDVHDAHTVAQYDTRTANTLVRCYIDGAGPETWDFTAGQSAIDAGNYNTGAALVATNVGKYYRGLFVISEDNVFWIYAQEQHNTLAAALEGADPSTPPGIGLFPKSMAYVYKHGDADFVASTDPRWEDERPRVGISGGGVTVGDLSTYVQGDAGGSTDNYLTVWDGVSGVLVKDGDVTSVNFGSGAAANQVLNFVSAGGTGAITWVDATTSWTLVNDLSVAGSILATTSVTTPLVIGGTAAASTLTLQGSNTSPSGDSVIIKSNGAQTAAFSGSGTDADPHMLLIGSAVPVGSYNDEVIVTDDDHFCVLATYAHSSSSANDHASFRLCRSRGSAAVPSVVSSGDFIGSIAFTGYGTAAYASRARILCEVDGAVSGTTIPMRMVFQAGTSALTESFRVKSDQHVLVASDNQLQFRDTATYIYSSASSDLDIVATDELNIRSNTGIGVQIDVNDERMDFFNVGAGLYGRIGWGAIGTLKLFGGSTPTEGIRLASGGIGFYGHAVASQPTITGARDDPEAALADLLSSLDGMGIIVDSTTAS